VVGLASTSPVQKKKKPEDNRVQEKILTNLCDLEQDLPLLWRTVLSSASGPIDIGCSRKAKYHTEAAMALGRHPLEMEVKTQGSSLV
jgi:hypothetical protein